MKLKHLATAIAIAAAGLGAQAATTVAFGYATESQLYVWGTGKAETYDVAIYIDNPALVGNKITGVEVPFSASTNITDYKVWLSTELALDADKKNVANIASVAATVQDGVLSATFDNAYTITDGGVYVGYSFTVSSVATQADQYPVTVTDQVTDNGLYLHTSRTYKKWGNKSETLGCTSAITALVEGDYADNSVSLVDAPMAYAKADEPNVVNVPVYNYGSKEVASVDYTLTVKGKEYTGSYTFATPIPNMLGRKGIVPVEFPAKAKGEYDYTLTITKVNGEANQSDAATLKSRYYVFVEFPVNRPVMEEFTGTWCGWCVRGWMAMEKMNEFYPDEFIGLAYHNGDPMQIAGTDGLIGKFSGGGFPSCTVNRLLAGMDPYYATANSGFGIKDYWEALHEQFNPCAVNVAAGWTDDSHTAINVNAEVTFLVDMGNDDADYRVEYVLVGNKIKGAGSGAWLQGNYYAGGNAGCPQYMEPFVTGEYRSGSVAIPFNDVVLATTGGKGVAGSLDGYRIGKTKKAYHTFEGVDQIKSTYSGYTSQPIPYNADELYVVAIVLDMSNGGYGTVVNTGRGKVDGVLGVANVMPDASKPVQSVTYYDLSGRQVANPQGGIYIRSTRYTDGTVANTKVSVK